MSTNNGPPAPPAPLDREPTVGDLLAFGTPAFPYVALCGVCLTVILLAQMAQGHSALFGLLVLLAGVTGVLLRTAIAPAGLVLLVAAGQMIRLGPLGLEFGNRGWVDPDTRPLFSPGDVPLCVAVLGFVIGNYRLLGLHRHIFPPDYRLLALRRIRARGTPWQALRIEQRRPVAGIRPLEQVLLVLALPLWALAGQVAWAVISRQQSLPALEDATTIRVTVGMIFLVPTVVTAAALLRVWRLRRITADEAALLMQDHLWRETRGEQRLLTRWLAWFWLRDKERKEQR